MSEARPPPVAPRLGERRVRFTADGTEFDLVVPSDMSVLQILRDIAGHPRPAWRCELGVCGSCESVMNGEVVRLCTFGPKRLDGAVIITPEPRPDPGPLFP